MAVAVSARPRVVVDGKFFRLGQKKFYVKGIVYGPFAPDADGHGFPSLEQTARDLDHIATLNANVVRVYEVPPRWFLDLADARNLKVFIDIPWNKHLAIDSPQRRADAKAMVRRSVSANAKHPAIFAFSVANEIPTDLVRWIGASSVAEFIDELIGEAKASDPDCLCTYTNFPPTEFLRPQAVDFHCFNVYLHHEPAFKSYLSRLQMMADSKPLVLGEFGVDSIREGEERKCEMLSWQIEGAFRAGLAGAVVFTYTDEWFFGGRMIEDWAMGLTTKERVARPSAAVVGKQFGAAPYFPLPSAPKVSVVIASYNGDRTLKACLDSLKQLNYPNYEVILVDDGSDDGTRQFPVRYPEVRYIRHEKNLGLSAARNTGILASTGDVIAFTDSDCRADEDWLYYLVSALIDGDFAGVGGPNLLPPDDSAVGAAVMVSPGGPAHVMLTDRKAEHIPGCNMAFHRRALEEIGGFDPIFTRAGDDVDLCWRLQQAGHDIGFSPAAFVWHYRRSTVGAYLKQQRGYGEAEAMLVRKHPENFNSLGGGIWRGRIYGPSRLGIQLRPPVIYHGSFGSAGFQKIYATEPATVLMFCTTPEYHLFITLPLLVLSVTVPQLFPVPAASFLVSIGVCIAASAQAAIPRNKLEWWSRPLVALLFFLQPIVRGWARYRGRLAVRPPALSSRESLDSVALLNSADPLDEAQYWSERPVDRLAFVASIIRQLDARGWPNRSDSGWNDFDVEIHGSRWAHLQLVTAHEEHPGNRRLLRVRLRGVWSLTARITFWTLTASELLLIGVLGPTLWWPWLVLLTLPLFAWWFKRAERKLKSIIAVLLNEFAKQQEFVIVEKAS